MLHLQAAEGQGVAAEGASLEAGMGPANHGAKLKLPQSQSVCCQRFHQRGQFPCKSCLGACYQCLAVLAEGNTVFALAICLALKTFLYNARVLGENIMLSLLGWAQERCFECKYIVHTSTVCFCGNAMRSQHYKGHGEPGLNRGCLWGVPGHTSRLTRKL